MKHDGDYRRDDFSIGSRTVESPCKSNVAADARNQKFPLQSNGEIGYTFPRHVKGTFS